MAVTTLTSREIRSGCERRQEVGPERACLHYGSRPAGVRPSDDRELPAPDLRQHESCRSARPAGRCRFRVRAAPRRWHLQAARSRVIYLGTCSGLAESAARDEPKSPHSLSGSPSTVQRRRSRRSCLGKLVLAWVVQRLSHMTKSSSRQTCSKMNSRRSPIS